MNGRPPIEFWFDARFEGVPYELPSKFPIATQRGARVLVARKR